MIRWGFIVLLVAAVLMRFTPVAFADGCEGGDTSAGHNAIAFCCGDGGADRGKGGVDKGVGKAGAARIIAPHVTK